MSKRKSLKSIVRSDRARRSVDLRREKEKIEDPNKIILSTLSRAFVLDSLRTAVESELDDFWTIRTAEEG